MQEITTTVTASSEKCMKQYCKPRMIFFALHDRFKDAFSVLLTGKVLKTPTSLLSYQRVNAK